MALPNISVLWFYLRQNIPHVTGSVGFQLTFQLASSVELKCQYVNGDEWYRFGLGGQEMLNAHHGAWLILKVVQDPLWSSIHSRNS